MPHSYTSGHYASQFVESSFFHQRVNVYELTKCFLLTHVVTAPASTRIRVE